MDANNFVGPSGDGFTVFVNGQYVGNYATQAEAEQKFNSLMGSSNARTTTTGGGKSVQQMRDELRAAAGYDVTAGMSDSQVAQRYTQVTGGAGTGNNGNMPGSFNMAGGIGQLDPMLAAGQLSYNNRRLDVYDIPTMQYNRALAQWQQAQQGMGQTGYYTSGGPGSGMSREQVLDAIWQKRPDLKTFFESNGWTGLDDPVKQREAVAKWLTFSPEGEAAGGDPVRAAQAMGIEGTGALGVGYAGQAGALPTFDREKYNEDVRRYGQDYAESQRRFNVGQGNWEQEFGEGRRRFDTGTRLDYNRLLSTIQGPRNYRRYEAMLPEVFGAVTPGDSWEQAGTEFAASGRTEPSRAQLAGWYGVQGAPTEAGGVGANPDYRNPGNNVDPASQGFSERSTTLTRGAASNGWETNAQKEARQRQPRFRQPTSIKADELATMSPTRRAMTESDWSYEGLDPQDMWEQTRRAQPTGQAAANTRWRF